MNQVAHRVRLVVEFDIEGASPREVRDRFIEAARQAIIAGQFGDRFDLAVAEELIRALPEPGKA